ncbi:42104_t:CDS:1, partial [Gigaspora margarita]
SHTYYDGFKFNRNIVRGFELDAYSNIPKRPLLIYFVNLLVGI